ncbi:MAG: RluA family pseudouridine synthase [Turicibacter sp.]|nr:RluA family pseudouridine synthase [Turicibacter sp.]
MPSIQVPDSAIAVRLDVFAADILRLSRNNVQNHIQSGNILVNGLCVQKRYLLKAGDTIICNIPEPEPYRADPEDIPLEIVYEDSDIIVINKRQGMVVHPAPGNYTGTLVNALLHYCDDLSGVNGIMRPGIVHRLDKHTSGLIIVAKNDFAHHNLSEQLQTHSIQRTYYAIVCGVIKRDELEINLSIGRHSVDRKKMAVSDRGKSAITLVSVLRRYKAHSLLKVNLKTGRTHQIRVHLAHMGYPILNDPIYNHRGGEAQILHAKSLSFCHPRTLQQTTLNTPLPPYFIDVLRKI